MSKKIILLLASLVAALVLVACGGETVEVTRVVEVESEPETIVQEVETEVTRVVEGEVVTETVVEEVIVTATPLPAPQGGTIIESSFSDWSNLNPIISSDSASSNVWTKMFETSFQTDPFTGEIVGNILESWTVSDDGLVWTFTINDDIMWTDGTPVTATDVAFTWDAIVTEEVASPRRSNLSTVDSWNVIDDFTLEVTLNTLDCTVLANLPAGVIPAHVYDNDPLNVPDSPENQAPTVTNGPFVFGEHAPDEFTSVLANDSYYLGRPNTDGYTVRVFADQSAELAGFLAGEIDYTGVSPQFVSVIESEIAKGQPFEIRKFFNDGYTYVGFNMADPANPQLGWIDENENGVYDEGEPPQPQDPHPVLGDKAVRQAISYSIDYTGIINKVAFGQGGPMVANVLPAIDWAYNSELTPYAQDLELAASILDEAGWTDGDGDGVRENADGTPLSFTIMTNAGNETRENIAVLLKETLDEAGFAIELEIIDFGTVVQKLLGQEFDAVIIGWIGLGSDPDDKSLFSLRNDEPGAGFNFVSFYDETFEDNLWNGLAVPGCAAADRAPFYTENQAIFNDLAPYAVLYNPLGNTVWNTRLGGIDPAPWSTEYNIEQWFFSD